MSLTASVISSESRDEIRPTTAGDTEQPDTSTQFSASIQAPNKKRRQMLNVAMFRAYERLQLNRGPKRIIRIRLSDTPDNYKKGRMEVIEKQLLKDLRWPKVFARVVWIDKKTGEGIITARWRNKEVDYRDLGAVRTVLSYYGLAQEVGEDGGVTYVLSERKGDIRVFDHRVWIQELEREGTFPIKAHIEEVRLALILEPEFWW